MKYANLFSTKRQIAARDALGRWTNSRIVLGFVWIACCQIIMLRPRTVGLNTNVQCLTQRLSRIHCSCILMLVLEQKLSCFVQQLPPRLKRMVRRSQQPKTSVAINLPDQDRLSDSTISLESSPWLEISAHHKQGMSLLVFRHYQVGALQHL